MYVFFILIILFIGLFFLYESGFIALQSKRAMLFTASMNGMKARFGSCTGKITRIIRFKEKREYTLRLESSLEKGSVSFSLIDREGNTLLESGETGDHTFTPVPGTRCKLRILINKASGSYKIHIA